MDPFQAPSPWNMDRYLGI
jgi:Asp-tRNA(Asn)/Glu-tRNA(Gln) amidotransferase A subunit family amidase